MSLFKRSHLSLVFMVLATVCHGAMTTVTMKSGERLIGTVLPETDESTLVMRSALLGEVKLPKAQILKQELNDVVLAGKDEPEVVAQAPDTVKTPGKPMQLSEAEKASIEETSLFQKISNAQTPDNWDGNMRFGLDVSSGDSEWSQLYSKGNLVIDPKRSPSYYRFSGSYTYRTTERNGETVKSTDRYDANFTYRRDAIGPFFIQNSIGGRVDRVKGINHEVQELVGVGLRIKPVERFEFILGGSGGVEDYDADFEDSRSGINPVANAFQELTWRPFDKATLAQELNYYMEPDEGYKYNYVFSTSFRYRLTEMLGYEISYNKDFDSDVGDGNVRDISRWRHAIIVYF